MQEVKNMFRHADGGLYELLGTADGAGPQAGLLPFAVYRGEDGRLWYREPWSFNQRFTKEGAE